MSEDTCCSFEEWKRAGYMVQRGEKSQFRDPLGIPQFTIEQVKKLEPSKPCPSGLSRSEMEEQKRGLTYRFMKSIYG